MTTGSLNFDEVEGPITQFRLIYSTLALFKKWFFVLLGTGETIRTIADESHENLSMPCKLSSNREQKMEGEKVE
jgi:hypothetical protein